MKKTLLALVFALLSLNIAKGADTVYINTPQEFIQFSKNVDVGNYRDATVFLQNDIDLTGLSDQFEPIGNIYGNGFYGTLDGQGHTISHLTYHNTRYWYAGLVGFSLGATVRNIIMDKTCSITGISALNTSSHTETMSYGGIVGACQAAKKECIIENNIFMGKVEFSGVTDQGINLHIGGIVGDTGAAGYTVVSNCVNYGTVSFTGKTALVDMGGVVGTLILRYYNSYGYSRLYNCLNYGFISFTGTATKTTRIGGVIGSNDYADVEIDNIVNFGTIYNRPKTVSPTEEIGSLIGMLYYVNMRYSYWSLGSGYGPVGEFYNDEATMYMCANFSTSTLVLSEPVSIGTYYYGVSLVLALNGRCQANLTARYSKWLLNKDNHDVTFSVNNEAPFFKMNSQLIQMPNRADAAGKKFDGWYTDSTYTTPITNFYVYKDLDLYGKYV